jgi:hypothetical protein
MARKRLVPVNQQRDPDYYLHGRERRIRRESWEWPEHERHPAVGVYRESYRDAWRAVLGDTHSENRQLKFFPDKAYGGTQEALNAAIAWRTAAVKKLGPGWKSTGWKLSPESAGNVFLLGNGTQVRASLVHDGARCWQTFSFGPRSGRSREDAIRLAELALEIWREEAQRIAKMPRYKQERIAERGGWTAVRGFPAKYEPQQVDG